ncbi:unnamed protein product, partial [Rotaria magnacalcarata]
PNPEYVQIKQTREKVKKRAVKELMSIGKIYDEEMAVTTMNSVAVAIFPTVHEIYPAAVKNRRKLIPPVPDSSFF